MANIHTAAYTHDHNWLDRRQDGSEMHSAFAVLCYAKQ